jgi:hypothetical protein
LFDDVQTELDGKNTLAPEQSAGHLKRVDTVTERPIDFRAKEEVMRLTVVAGLVTVLLLWGCAGLATPSPDAPTQIMPLRASAEAVAPASLQTPRPSAPRPAVASQAGFATIEPVSGSATPSSAASAGNTAPLAAKVPAQSPASRAPAAPLSRQHTTPPAVAMPKAPPLDLASLEQRLKETQAIGLLTKITLRNQVGDLLNQFRSFYQGTLKTDLADLRRSYDLLVLKVLSLLQDGDRRLATAIAASREAIWGILSDPVKFSKI